METGKMLEISDGEGFFKVIPFADYVASIIDEHAKVFSNLNLLRKKGEPLVTKDFFEFIDTLLWADDVSQIEASFGLPNNEWIHSYIYYKLQLGYLHTQFGKVAVH